MSDTMTPHFVSTTVQGITVHHTIGHSRTARTVCRLPVDGPFLITEVAVRTSPYYGDERFTLYDSDGKTVVVSDLAGFGERLHPDEIVNGPVTVLWTNALPGCETTCVITGEEVPT